MSDPEDKTSTEASKDILEEPQIYSDDVDEAQNVEELKNLYKTIKDGIRPPITGSEQLLATELAIANLSPPLDKIRHICEGLMLLTSDEIELIKLGTDIEHVKRVHLLAVAFTESWETFDFDENNNERQMVKIAFSFNPEEASKYFYPWVENIEFEGYISLDRMSIERIQDLQSAFSKRMKEIERKLQHKEQVSEEILNDFKSLHSQVLYWSLRDGLTIESFRSVKTAFVGWAMPQAVLWLKQSMTLINPDAFKDAVFALRGGTPPQKTAFKKGN